MSNHSICIDSPFFRLPPFHPHLRIEPEPQPEESEVPLFPFMLKSPDILPPTFGPNSSIINTPWPARLCNEQQKRAGEIILPSLFCGEEGRMQAIEDRIVYSEAEEDYQLMTPARGEKLLAKEESSSFQLLTTGRKQDSEPVQSGDSNRGMKFGLRKLTAKAYRIVEDMRNATYKDVAERLVYEIKHGEAELGEEREEQNVKRRVYDALNVLLAVGVIRKDGRKVATLSANSKHTGKNKSTLQQPQIESLKQQVEAKEARLHALRQKLRESEEKLQSVRWLLTKNVQSGQKKDQHIPFPFIGIAAPAHLSAEQLSPSQVLIRSENPILPLGDMDTLRWLNTQ